MFLIRLLVRGYQLFLNPLLKAFAGSGAGCRFDPSCSRYFLQACEIHGVTAGTWLGLKRIARCHPWSPVGPDPVPARQIGARQPRAQKSGAGNASRC